MKKAWAIAPDDLQKLTWEDVWRFDYASNHISIGWARLENVIGLNEKQIKERIKALRPPESAHPGYISGQFQFFYKEIKIGDIILARKGMKQIAGLGVVTGEPYYDPKRASESKIPNYNHPNFLPVRWIRDFRPIKHEKIVFLRPTIQPFNNREILNTIENYFKLDPSDSEADLQNSAIDDIPSAPIGSKTPDRTESSGWRYQRDDKVRKFVIEQAKGTCEYCGKLGFVLPDDNRYLEARHIIALAKQGPDTVENVIALCPSDHREAHYGKKRIAMENEMLETIKTRQASTS
jgi:hypothetical protein